MANQKIDYSENEKANGKMSDDSKRIEAFNQNTSELQCRSDDGKDFDEKRCMKCILSGAKHGLAPVQFILGECYEFGEKGFKQNKKEAVKWYRKAAEQNEVNAQFNLGCCYADGEGVQQDKLKAAKWFYNAAKQGDKSAKDALFRLLNNVDDDDEGETVQV